MVLFRYTAPTDRVYLAVGTNMQAAKCKNGTVNTACQAAFLGIHLTSGSSAYFEVSGIDSFIPTSLHSSNGQGTWLWTADHDLDAATDTSEISVFTGRGILSESAGPVWLIGTCMSIVPFFPPDLDDGHAHSL